MSDDVEAIVRSLTPLQEQIIAQMSGDWGPVFETTALNLVEPRLYRPALCEVRRSGMRQIRLNETGLRIRQSLLSQAKE